MKIEKTLSTTPVTTKKPVRYPLTMCDIVERTIRTISVSDTDHSVKNESIVHEAREAFQANLQTTINQYLILKPSKPAKKIYQYLT